MAATHGGKGSGQRARLVDHKKFSDNWDLAFKQKPKEPVKSEKE